MKIKKANAIDISANTRNQLQIKQHYKYLCYSSFLIFFSITACLPQLVHLSAQSEEFSCNQLKFKPNHPSFLLCYGVTNIHHMHSQQIRYHSRLQIISIFLQAKNLHLFLFVGDF
jgi:hypothetical protein